MTEGNAWKSARVTAVVRAPERRDLIARALAAAQGGLQRLALPASIPFVAEIAAEIADLGEVTVGLCDVVAVEHINVALAAGAEFVISPVFDRELLELGQARGLDILPCVMTPNELHAAAKVHRGPIGVAPVQWIGGTEYVGSLCRMFPDLSIVAMGGVGSDNAAQYLERGASAVVVDTGLFPEEMDPESARIIAVRAGALLELCMDIVVGERQSAP